MTAHTAVQVFQLAFGRWVTQDDPGGLHRLMIATLDDLRSLVGRPPAGGTRPRTRPSDATERRERRSDRRT